MNTLVGSNALQWAALTGILLPPVAALVQKEHWPDIVNAAVFGGACVAAAFGVAALDQSSFNWSNWRQSLIAIIGAGLALYKLYWAPSGAIAAARAVPVLGNSAPAAAPPAA